MAVEDVAIAAHHAVGAVEALPQTVRWQTELLLYALDEDPTMRQLFRDADQASDALETVADTVEKLPDHVRQTIRDVEATQPEFRKTLAEGHGIVEQARLTVEQAGQNLDKLQETMASIEPVTANTKEAGHAWEGAFTQLNLLANPPKDPNAPPKPDAPPFDIKEAARTAEWATKAAGEVKETVVELRQIVEGEGLDQRLAQIDTTTQSALDRTVASAGDLIDRITWRAVLVIVVFFVALLGYRFAAAFVPRREE
jgi:ABC-type transporter Mla subunit MlaD